MPFFRMKTLRERKKTGQNKEYYFLRNTHGKTSFAEFFQISFLKITIFIKKPQGTRRRSKESPLLNTALGAFSGWYFQVRRSPARTESVTQLVRKTLAKSLELSAQMDLV
jgi:hypothetical protein